MSGREIPADVDEAAATLIAVCRAMLHGDQAAVDVLMRGTDPTALASAAAMMLITTLRGLLGDDPQAIDDALAELQHGWLRLQAGPR